jgi:hypothetical protein
MEDRFTIHILIMKEPTVWVHSHGLEKIGQPNFSIIVPSVMGQSAAEMLGELCLNVLDKSEKFEINQVCDHPRWGWFTFDLEDPALVKDEGKGEFRKIVPLPWPECSCVECLRKRRN